MTTPSSSGPSTPGQYAPPSSGDTGIFIRLAGFLGTVVVMVGIVSRLGRRSK